MILKGKSIYIQILVMSITNDDANIDTNEKSVIKKTTDKVKKKKTVIQVPKDDVKYKITLKLVNRILVNIGEKEIDDLTKFVNVDREDIIKEINNESFKDMVDEIYGSFDKVKCGYYRKTNSAVYSCLRGMVKQLGYKFEKKKKEKHEYINNRAYKRSHYLYSIV